jgi:hypothetical protein
MDAYARGEPSSAFIIPRIPPAWSEAEAETKEIRSKINFIILIDDKKLTEVVILKNKLLIKML